jgi:hypothetical protein
MKKTGVGEGFFGLLIRLFEGRRVVKVKGRKRGVIRK